MATMDWHSMFNGLTGHDPNEMHSNGHQVNGSEAEVDDENADFYGENEAQAGASAVESTPQKTNAIETKTDYQKRAELLRAKLLAQRNNTPARPQPTSRSNTPAKAAQLPAETPSKAPKQPVKNVKAQDMIQNNQNGAEPPSEVLNLDVLLDHGKAMADEQSAALAAESRPNHSLRPDNLSKACQSPSRPANGIHIAEPQNSIVPLTNGHQHKNTAKKEMVVMSKEVPVPEAQPKPVKQLIPETQPKPVKELIPKRQTNLSDAYYADLPAWLEMTGFHDVDFRNSKLAAYKERKSLEEEAARIAERLEKLRQLEQESVQSLRFGTPITPAAAMAPPPLPSSMVVEQATGQVNGTKRAHSPEPISSSKRREENGFRIRGANDSPETHSRPPTAVARPSPPGINRRISYPDPRRRSDDDVRSRDPSLERRQSFYRRDSDRDFDRDFDAPQTHPRGPKSDYAARERDYDHYQPHDTRGDTRDGGPRLGFSTTNMARPRGPPAAPASQYRGSAGLDLKRGGVRYFMIKSWNHENVLAAQRDNLWATQEKNTQLLTDAFKNSRHVILLFSVNKSMAFQGYALMTTAPDPSLPKPGSASKLNWKTSPAFRLRWLATTPVHFRMVGHLKNGYNLDERGDSRAVLVGKDGQEISADAGMGVVWILDEVEAGEKDQPGRGG